MITRTILSTVAADSDEKWIWPSHAPDLLEASAAKISVAKPIVYGHRPGTKRKIESLPAEYFEDDDDHGESHRARYEVHELNEQYSGGRPINAAVTRRPYGKRTKPTPPTVNAGEYSYQLSGNSPIPSRRESLGVLTGPVPSWEKATAVLHKNGDPTNFEFCKCSFSFNCRSPGIQFGSCDQGKMYCCYNEFGSGKVINDSNNDGSKKIERVVVNPRHKVSNGNRKPDR